MTCAQAGHFTQRPSGILLLFSGWASIGFRLFLNHAMQTVSVLQVDRVGSHWVRSGQVRPGCSRARHVVPGAASHLLNLADEIVDDRVGGVASESGCLHDQEWAGGVVKEEVLVGFVEL